LNLSRKGEEIPSYLAFSFAIDYPAIAKDAGSFLHPNELRYFHKLEFPLRKTSFLLGRHAAKKALSAYLKESDPNRIEIAFGVFTQPVVKYGCSDKPELTIAHCQDAAVAIAFQSGHPMGVDLEYIEAEKRKVFENQFTDSELNLLKCLTEVDEDSYYLLWTIREALSKALKCGLTVPFSILEVEQIVQDGAHAYTCLFKNFVQYQARSWIDSQHVLSIALPKETQLTVNPFAAAQARNRRPF
jgi:phosphopantetheine--protein transferase-like protein